MKNKVSILLAIYHPNLDYLVKLLFSIENQTYRNIELLVVDDSHNREISEKVLGILKSKIINTKYTFLINDKNLGSNKSFEKLTALADSHYLAFCDQDDIWELDKISKLLKEIQKENSLLCYSDLSIIDKDDNNIAASFKEISKRLNHVYGKNKMRYYLRRNSVTGCTMLINTSYAKQCIPFPLPEIYIHDHWLALNSAKDGRISYVKESLIRYRLHDNNQIGAKVLVDIHSKSDYLYKKLKVEKMKVDFLKNHDEFNNKKNTIKEILRMEDFVNARIAFFEKKSFRNLIRFIIQIYKDPQLVIFEFFLNNLPENLSLRLLRMVKN